MRTALDSLRLAYFIVSRWIVLVAVTALTLAHPLIHGTPLDSGILDAWLVALQTMVVTQR